MDLIYLFRVLLRRKWIIIAAAIIAAGAAYYFTMNQPKKFLSTAEVSTGFTVSDQITVNDEKIDPYQADTKFNNIIVTWNSPSVTSLLGYKLILHDLQNNRPFRQLTAEQKQSPIYKNIDTATAIKMFSDKLEDMSMLTSYKPDEKKMLEYLKLYGYDYKSIGANMNVYRKDRTDFIQIDYFSENPELSAFAANNSFDQFLRYYKNLRSGIADESVDTLKSLKEKKKEELDKKDAALQKIGVVGGSSDENTSQYGVIASLQQELSNEKSNQITLQSSLQKVNGKISSLGSITSTTRSVADNEELIILRGQMNDAYKDYLNSGSTDKALFNKYNNLKTQYLAKYASSAPVDDKTTSSNTRLKNDLLEEKAGIDIDIEANKTKIASLEKQINQQKGSANAVANRGAEAESMLKDREIAYNEYIAAKKKYDDAIDVNTSSVNNFRQMLHAQPAIDPEPSKRKLIIIAAGFAAMIMTMLVIILLAYLDSSVKTPNIFAKIVNLKMISMVNFTDLEHRSLPELLSKHPLVDEPDKNRENIFRESIRKLRYAIENTNKKIFLFTSTKKGMGKTTLIQAVSYSLSLSQKKILIIDTNFCNNDLTKQLHADPILEKIIPGTKKDENVTQQVRNAAKDIGVGTVFVIGSEGGDYTPSEILPKDNILKHLHEIINDFDYIFLEGPPLNDFSDSKELVQYVDGVIAVFSATHIIKQIDKESIGFFRELEDKFCGAILNKVDLRNVNVA